ncbi:MAG: hypothetical protein L0229_32210 [Blastocatellia bacterium]|nr:hypothetical protein [Blastocatellia bacterium]
MASVIKFPKLDESNTVFESDAELRITESSVINDIGVPDIGDYLDSQTGEIAKYYGNSHLVKGEPKKNLSGQISIDDLYPARQAISPELSTALHLLNEGIANVEEALSALEARNDIGADAAIQRLQALLPELFCCRQLSDSFGAIIVATFHALRNSSGQPLKKRQMVALGKILRSIRDEPFMSYDKAVDEIIELENVGFVVEPKEFEYLADLLDE